jgi:hypothetical protein
LKVGFSVRILQFFWTVWRLTLFVRLKSCLTACGPAESADRAVSSGRCSLKSASRLPARVQQRISAPTGQRQTATCAGWWAKARHVHADLIFFFLLPGGQATELADG